MAKKTLGLGTFVLYRLSAEDVDRINQNRFAMVYTTDLGPMKPCTGNSVAEDDIFPLLITRVSDDDTVNGQVFLDGNDTLWVTSRVAGDGPGMFEKA